MIDRLGREECVKAGHQGPLWACSKAGFALVGGVWCRLLPSTFNKAKASAKIAPIKQPLVRGAEQDSNEDRPTSQPQSLTSESGGHTAALWGLWVPGRSQPGPRAGRVALIPLSLSLGPEGQLVQCRRWVTGPALLPSNGWITHPCIPSTLLRYTVG